MNPSDKRMMLVAILCAVLFVGIAVFCVHQVDRHQSHAFGRLWTVQKYPEI